MHESSRDNNDRRSRGATHALLDASGNRSTTLRHFLNGPAGHRTNSEDLHKVQYRQRRTGTTSEPISRDAPAGGESIYVFGTEAVAPKP